LDLLAKFGISWESIVEFWREGNYIKQGEQLLSPLVTP